MTRLEIKVRHQKEKAVVRTDDSTIMTLDSVEKRQRSIRLAARGVRGFIFEV